PFGINVFAPQRPPRPPKDEASVVQRVAPLFAEVGLPPPAAPALPADVFADQVAACLETSATVFSFTFGVLPESAMKAVKQRGLFRHRRGRRGRVLQTGRSLRARRRHPADEGLLRPARARDREPVHGRDGARSRGDPSLSAAERAHAAPAYGGREGGSRRVPFA